MLWASRGCCSEVVQGCRCLAAVAVFGLSAVVEVVVLVAVLLRLVNRRDLLALGVGLREARTEGRTIVRLGLGLLGLPICACVNPMSDVKMRMCAGSLIATLF